MARRLTAFIAAVRTGPMKHLVLLGLFLSLPGIGWSLTLSDIRTAIRRNVRDTGTSLRRYSDAILLAYINEAQRSIISSTWASNDATTASVVAGTTFYAMPAEAIKPWRVTYNGANLPESDLKQIDMDQENGAWGATTSTPTSFFIDKSTPSAIGLAPVPAASGASLRIAYFQLVPDLASDTDVPFDSDFRLYQYHDLIVYHASFRILSIENRTAEAQVYSSVYDAGLSEMNTDVGHKPVRAIAPSREVKP